MKALLFALLEPTSTLRSYEIGENFFARLALLEDLKIAPVGAVWEKFCSKQDVPGDFKWAKDVLDHERDVLSKR